MTKTTFAVILTAAALAVVGLGRSAGGDLTAGVPSQRVRGPSGAPVQLVVFSDFQCPACAAAEPALKELLTRHGDRIRLSFRHFPLRMHRWAVPAARAAEAAGVQGKFWEFHDILFQRQKDWSLGDQEPTSFFSSYARELGLDEARFRRDLTEGRWDGLLRADVAAARRLTVSATPTVFINGQRLVGPVQIRNDGERLVQEALQ